MITEKDYKLYDEIVSASIHNLINYSRKNDRIVLLGFNRNDIYNKYIYKIALITCSICPRDEKVIVLHMNPFKYLLFKLTHWKNRKFIKYFGSMYEDDEPIDSYALCMYRRCPPASARGRHFSPSRFPPPLPAFPARRAAPASVMIFRICSSVFPLM